jgi:hypothetical protein
MKRNAMSALPQKQTFAARSECPLWAIKES